MRIAQPSSFADKIKAALNKHLWSEDDGAFSDCRHVDGKLSATASANKPIRWSTYVVVPKAIEGQAGGICSPGTRAWVQIGSPFMMFFSLEALVQQGQFPESSA